jgi:hypothetical protein
MEALSPPVRLVGGVVEEVMVAARVEACLAVVVRVLVVVVAVLPASAVVQVVTAVN